MHLHIMKKREENGVREVEKSNRFVLQPFTFSKSFSETNDWHVVQWVSVIAVQWLKLTSLWFHQQSSDQECWNHGLRINRRAALWGGMGVLAQRSCRWMTNCISLGFKGIWTFGVKCASLTISCWCAWPCCASKHQPVKRHKAETWFSFCQNAL